MENTHTLLILLSHSHKYFITFLDCRVGCFLILNYDRFKEMWESFLLSLFQLIYNLFHKYQMNLRLFSYLSICRGIIQYKVLKSFLCFTVEAVNGINMHQHIYFLACSAFIWPLVFVFCIKYTKDESLLSYVTVSHFPP